MEVLGLWGSPRRSGNTDLLLDQALAGAASCGARTEKLALAELDIHPCRHCDGCLKTGVCIVKDDMQWVHTKLRSTDRLILASPLFFIGVTAQTKIAIDRCQALWVEKYILKVRRPFAADGSRRRGLFISVGGMQWPDLFQPAIATVKAFFTICDLAYSQEIFFPGVDKLGEIKEHPTALDEAFDAGKRLVQE